MKVGGMLWMREWLGKKKEAAVLLSVSVSGRSC